MSKNLILKFKNRTIASFKALKEIKSDTKEFGFDVAITKWRRVTGIISAEKYINKISDFMVKDLQPIIEKYSSKEYSTITPKKELGDKLPVFVSWLQGEENMPEWIKACYNNLKSVLPPETQIHFITYDNYLEYIDIPQYVIDKFNKGVMCPANFSDIIRYALLATYGGVWLDLAVYLSKDAFEDALKYELYTPRFYDEGNKLLDASRGRWVGGSWFSKNSNILFKYVVDSLFYFWSRHDKRIDYLSADYIIWSGYYKIPEITELLDAIPINNIKLRLLNENLDNEYSEKLCDKIFKQQKIHLVNRHKEYQKETKDGKQTVYGYLVSANTK